MRHFQLQKYLALPQGGKVIAEYVWIDGSNGLRSKSKVSNFQHRSLPPRYTAAFATANRLACCVVLHAAA
jgi:hypothetical protein